MRPGWEGLVVFWGVAVTVKWGHKGGHGRPPPGQRRARTGNRLEGCKSSTGPGWAGWPMDGPRAGVPRSCGGRRPDQGGHPGEGVSPPAGRCLLGGAVSPDPSPLPGGRSQCRRLFLGAAVLRLNRAAIPGG